ncbi:glutathione S-transferase [Paraphoma chrysanthemicola]|uniref:Glutathione S-transferase n=1 Tax=Paraphoma chrysanthemicola TaxID=798071 RepID=A0A8K0W5A6_9PLEO|nr:glutathione S-transferase [Paraphoma chrysanthemicola]
MQQQSSPVLQQLRTLHHPGTLQHLQQSPDGALYPHPQTIPLYQQQYALSGAPQPSPHALQYQQHGLPASPAQYPAAFPATYQHASSPRFAVANPPPLALQHFQQQVPLPQAPPLRAAPQASPQRDATVHPLQPLPQAQSHVEAQALAREADDAPASNHGQFQGLKLIADPPDLDAWRQRLFDVDDTMTLTEDEFKTYFPHIDNVYSHRSTQRHKRKRFVSHYWDCRLKGRPPGTKKSTDPDKKKRKRVARERDLCDVKIKITEYFDQHEYEEQLGQRPPGADDATSPVTTSVRHTAGVPLAQGQQFFSQAQMLPQRQPWDMSQSMSQPVMGIPQFTAGPGPPSLPRPPPKKFYTLQRVNGNGGNGKGDGVAGPHKHTLEESDRVKKNSVIRWLAKLEKDDRKKSQGGDPTKKTYHKRATGNALTTVKNHAKEDDLKLYGSAFCPFVQRVWISLEHKQIPYQYIEVDPYKKPQSLLDVNPRGLVPALRHGPTWSTHESTVIMEYLEDLAAGPALLPPDPQSRATSRLWSDHVNRHIIPVFYKLLQAQDANDQISHATELRTQIAKLVDAAHPTGPFFLGSQISFVDVQIAPWMIRLRRVLKPYRGWPDAEEGSRWGVWLAAVEEERSVRMTTSGDELYLDSYERYAENRPGTSQLADAVNSGRGLP